LDLQLFYRALAVKGACPLTVRLAKLAECLQPSSAVAERVFSLLRTMFGGGDQDAMLEDASMLGVMTRFNDLSRAKIP
jgi:hypothetical protein